MRAASLSQCSPLTADLQHRFARGGNALLRNSEEDKPVITQKTDLQILEILSKARSRLRERVLAYGHSISGIRGRISHAHETVEISDNVALRTVSQSYRIATRSLNVMKRAGSVPFPIMTVEKGHLPDDLHVSLRDGTTLAILPYEETLRLQLFMLEVLINGAFGTGTRDATFDETVRSAKRHIARYGEKAARVTDPSAIAEGEIVRRFQNIAALQGRDGAKETTNRVRPALRVCVSDHCRSSAGPT